MTTVLTVNTTETDPDKALDALKRAVALIDDLRDIKGLSVQVRGDLNVTIEQVRDESERDRLIEDIRRRLPVVAIGYPDIAAQVGEAMDLLTASKP